MLPIKINYLRRRESPVRRKNTEEFAETVRAINLNGTAKIITITTGPLSINPSLRTLGNATSRNPLKRGQLRRRYFNGRNMASSNQHKTKITAITKKGRSRWETMGMR